MFGKVYFQTDFTSFPQAGSLYQIRKDIVTLANNIRFEEVIQDDVDELQYLIVYQTLLEKVNITDERKEIMQNST